MAVVMQWQGRDGEDDEAMLAMKHFTRTIGASPDTKTTFADI